MLSTSQQHTMLCELRGRALKHKDRQPRSSILQTTRQAILCLFYPHDTERRPRINKRRGTTVQDVVGDGKASPGVKINKTQGLLRIPSRCEGREGKCCSHFLRIMFRLHTVKCLMLANESRFSPRVRDARKAFLAALTLRIVALVPSSARNQAPTVYVTSCAGCLTVRLSSDPYVCPDDDHASGEG